MKIFQIIMDEQEKNNLVAFLDRVNLVGKEVPAFLAVINHILQAEEMEEISHADHR